MGGCFHTYKGDRRSCVADAARSSKCLEAYELVEARFRDPPVFSRQSLVPTLDVTRSFGSQADGDDLQTSYSVSRWSQLV